MKGKLVTEKKGFKPFSIKLTIESEAEAILLHDVFNVTDLRNALGSQCQWVDKEGAYTLASKEVRNAIKNGMKGNK